MKKISALLLLTILITGISCSVEDQGYGAEDLDCWRDAYCVQERVDISREQEGIIRAKVDKRWQEYRTVDLPEKFIQWSVAKRLGTMERFRKHQPPELSGPHNAMVASYGAMRKDSQFKINNAVKGMGFLPKRGKIKAIIKMLEDTGDNPFPVKLDTLTALYEKAADIYDMSKQVSLELYATPEFTTQTFLNQMLNPVAALVFLDIPSYKIKAIVHLIHPDDPNLSDYERDIVRYINLIHSYFHGEFSKNFIAAVYHVVEVYDNSPQKEARGRRIAP
ncbi:hypothetical protein KJ762_11050 [bacterium]|nr:hypothetical protein [bacterium]MBU1063482.1 hypothetical protein [bacterium]MBU1635029.1 hypothetical protein [bacterium]MBU1873647.1 hypothetical protein [bacterium]